MAYGDLPASHKTTHAPGGTDALTGYVDTSTAQTVAGAKTWSDTNIFNSQLFAASLLKYNVLQEVAASRIAAFTVSTSTTSNNDCDASTAAFTVTLGTAVTSGYKYTITKTDSSTNAVTVTAATSIAGVAGSIKLNKQWDNVVVMSTPISGVFRVIGGNATLNPAPQSLYTNLTVPAGNTVSAVGTGVANQQKVFTSGYTIPANYFYPGMRVVVKGWGWYTATAAVNVQPEVYAGGTGGVKLIDAGALGLPSTQANCRYDFEIWLKCLTAGTSGSLEVYGRLIFMNPTANAAGALTFPVGADASANATTGYSVTYNTTSPQLVQLSAGYSSATSADTNTLRHIEFVGYPPGVASA